MNAKFLVVCLASLVFGLCFQSCLFFEDQTEEDGDTLTVGGIGFNMVTVTGGYTFPTGVDDSGSATVDSSYDIATTETTYNLWYTVYSWATTDAGDGLREDGGILYSFANAGKEGNTGTIGAVPTTTGQPVTTISWRDAIVWTNALTEYYNTTNDTNYECVYKSSGTPIRDSEDTNHTYCDDVTQDTSAKGFRLLTSNEWEQASRYQDGSTWTPGSYSSGATADYSDVTATEEVAWYTANSDSMSNIVATKISNSLGLYDMSGNVWELCFDLDDTSRIIRGGAWNKNSSSMQIGLINSVEPDYVSNSQGFRIARTKE